MILGDSLNLLSNKKFQKENQESIQLVFTSPPFPLAREKKYGNLLGQEYIDWIASYGPGFSKILKNNGSLVIEIGNAWNPSEPTMSTAPMEALLKLKDEGGFHLCQEFICHNPARLPGPAAWVTRERIRVKDSFTRIWWLAKDPYPKADNKKVLTQYSTAMKNLIKKQSYNSGLRPSEHKIGETSFLKENKGAIIPSFLDEKNLNMILKHGEDSLTIANTASMDKSEKKYVDYCKKNNIKIHPARMPHQLCEFFIRFLSDENDIVLDPFGGSNITGAVAERLNRKWICIEKNESYFQSSKSRFYP